MKKVLIVGGVAGGASAAARLRRLDENIEIVMFERGEHISFANCGLPYYIGETIQSRDALLLQTPEKMKDRFNIDVRIFSEVVKINGKEKTVKVKSKYDGEYEESFDYLILSPGAKPIFPKLEGSDSEKIYTLRNVWDTDKIKAKVDSGNIKSAVVIGGGFIGIEMAENLVERGVKVTLIEAAPHVMAPLDTEMSMIVENELRDNGVKLVLNNKVSGFEDTEDSINVLLESGDKVEVDMVISAIGVTPDTEFIKNSGIDLGVRGHIVVDKNMKTNIDGIYAAGDAVQIKDFVNGEVAYIPLAGPANRQGRIIADNVYGIKSEYKGTLGTSIIKVFDMVAASTGNNERTLKRLNIQYKKAYIHPMSHAGYYPGATPLTIKVLYDLEGKILGAQAVGYEGVDKFIDVMATSIKLGGTMEDLADLELAYAPPFLSAKSPANMIGFVAQNEEKGLIKNISVEELALLNKDDYTLLDVRDDIEVENGIIEGAIHISVNDIRKNLNNLGKNKEIIVYCAVGIRGYIAGRILNQNGFKVRNVSGGFKSFLAIQEELSMNKGTINKVNKEEELKTIMEEKINKLINEENTEIVEDNTEAAEEIALGKITELNATGLCCPGPLMQVKMAMDTLSSGDTLHVTASDAGFYRDIEAWAKRTGNTLINVEKNKGIIEATLKKGNSDELLEAAVCNSLDPKCNTNGDNGSTIVVFSGDLDKAIASFIIANGAAAMGKEVTLFFTFWGLNILRRNEKVKANKNIIEKAFGIMMPRGSKKLSLSKMNMGGMGSKMIRGIMKNKNVDSLEDLIQSAIDNGVKLVACTMSMDVMGIKEEELIDGVEMGGVGYYLGEAEGSKVNLFI